jgi:hypothetical protein
MIPTANEATHNKKRKVAPADNGETEAVDILVNSLDQDTGREGNANEYINDTERSSLQVNLSSSSESDTHFHIGTTADLNTDLNIPNDTTRSNKMESVGYPSEKFYETATSRTGRPPIQLYLTCDDDAMSPYQCFVRKSIELFEADVDDVETNAQGRNKPIVLGQVGIRCRYCNSLPPNQRKRGATYYPSKLDGIYQAANNIAVIHLGEHCDNIDDQFRKHLTNLRNMQFTGGSGKKIWAERAVVLGVFEDLNGLRFEPTINYRQRNYLDVEASKELLNH